MQTTAISRVAIVLFIALLGACQDHEQITAPGAALFDTDHHHPPGEGTHLRGGNLTWRQVGPNTAEFTYTISFRYNAYFPTLGQQRNFTSFQFGDGSSTTPLFTVTHVDVAENWFEARAVFQKTYSGPGPWVAFNQICCRLSPAPANHSTSSGAFPWDLRNNADQFFRVETVVDFASAGAPTTGLPPVITCPREGDCQFNVPAIPRAGQTVRWRLATGTEMGGASQNNPGPPQAPNSASVNQNTGLYTWDTRGANAPVYTQPGWKTVYSTQVAMESLDANGNAVAKSVVDFLIHLTDVAANAPPVFDSPPSPADGSSFIVPVGQNLTFTVQASDPDTDDLVTLSTLGLPTGASFPIPAAANPVSSTFSWTPQSNQVGDYVVNFLAVDNRGLNAAPLSISIKVEEVTNQPPVAHAGGPYTGSEGSPVSFDGTGSSDPDGDPLSYTWDFGDGNVGTGATPTHTYLDNGVYTVTLTVSDGTDTDIAITTATISNVAPTVGAITGLPTDPISVNSMVNLSAGFTDPGVLDTHTAEIDWGDGATTVGNVDQGSGSGTVTGSHTYTTPGVYTVTITVTDNDGDSGSSSYEFVVVYDPNGGFVTGGGWTDVQAGSYAANPTAAGSARFGFVSKYLPGRNTPDGNTQFQFQAAGMNFHSESYDWLVVSGPRAQYKGTGRINRDSGYCFLLTAIDGQVNGGGGVDRLRLKIWDCADDSNVVFDNQKGEADNVEPTAITRGSIVIHNNRR